MEYKVIETYGIRSLEAEVNKYLAQGWEPLGGVSTATDMDGVGAKDCERFVQAIVKRK
ncbi:MAG: hypothetical protein QOG23_2369 [Blastocatellia bacterium]|jgi:hypothetical protein|nr:hypothetical protein [Blastocatellia bacterium]